MPLEDEFERLIGDRRSEKERIVPLRRFREKCVAQRRRDAFMTRVYLHSLDVCLRSENFVEMLLCVAPLAQGDFEMDDETGAECAALFLLYYVCYVGFQGTPSYWTMPMADVAPFLSTLANETGAQRLSHERVRFALSITTALQEANHSRFFALLSSSTRREHVLLKYATAHVQSRALSVLSLAYLVFPLRALQERLRIHSVDESDGSLQRRLLELLPNANHFWISTDGSQINFRAKKKT